MRRLKTRIYVLLLIAPVLIYLLTPAINLLLVGKYSLLAYLAFLKTNPLLWGKLTYVLKELPSREADLLHQLVTSIPNLYWDKAVSIVRRSLQSKYGDTLYILSITKPEKWHIVNLSIDHFLSDYRPFTTSRKELEREYVEPLWISGEEPIEDWRYTIYLFTYTLIYNKGDIVEATKTIYSFVHEYLEYDRAFWHRESPVTILRQGKGTCTNFSILFVAMCRSVGIPARLVRDNSITPATHAWAEVYVEGGGWIHVDPTAGFFNYTKAYSEKWGYSYHLVKAFNPIKGWINITPRYVNRCGEIVGIVLLDSKPRKGIEVSLHYRRRDTPSLLAIKTDENGMFNFTVAGGVYVVVARYGGITIHEKVEVEPGMVTRIQLRLRKS